MPRSAVQHAAPPSPDLSPRTDGEGERSGDDTEAEEGVLSRRPMQRMEKVRVLLGDGRRMDMIAMYDHHGHLMRNPMDARLAHIYPREHVDVPVPSALMRLPYDTVNAIIEASTGYIIDESSLAPPRRRSRSRGRSSVMSARPTVLPAAQAADVGAGAVDEFGMPLRHEASSRPSRRTSMLHHAPTTRAAAAAADADEPVQRELFTSRSHSMESTIFEDEPSALPSSTRGRSSVAYVPGFVEAASTTSVRRRSQGATNRRVSTAAH
ncbi:hypothetical protein EON67_08705 [archaeon]|nr:MAG: hypothetical protein EON67_08705 [archaeon]